MWMLLMLAMGCAGEVEVQPDGLDDIGVVQWNRIEARRCGEIEGKTWSLLIAEGGRSSTLMVTEGAPLNNDRMDCMNRWKARLRFDEGPARTVIFAFAPGVERIP
jgi:hypothetical protein